MRYLRDINVEQGPRATAVRFTHGLVTLTTRVGDEEGQDFTEYAMILAVVVTIAAAGISQFGSTLGTFITNTATTINSLF